MVKKIVNTQDLTYQEWLKYRQIGIGGSDAGAIAGLNPWKSPLGVYVDKVSPEAKGIPDNERMRIGRDLEDYVAKRFEEDTGKKVRRNNFMMQHEDHDFMVANVDREVVGENAVLECKTTNSYAKKDWQDGNIPIHYELQVHHYMAVGGYDKGYIAVLIGNEKFVWKEIPRDEEIINYLIEIEKHFWEEYIKKGNIPPADGSDDYSNILKEKYRGGLEEEVSLDIDQDEVNRLFQLKAIEKETKAQIKLIEQTIQTSMKDYNKAIIGPHSFTWKPQTRNRFDSKEFKKDYPELYEKYTKEAKIRVFRSKQGEDL